MLGSRKEKSSGFRDLQCFFFGLDFIWEHPNYSYDLLLFRSKFLNAIDFLMHRSKEAYDI